MKRNKTTEQFNFIGIAVVLLVIVGLSFFFDFEKIEEFMIHAGVWAPIIFIFLKVLTIVIAPLSGSALYPLAGLLFGFGPGFIYVCFADFIGYTTAFFISRIFGRKVAMKFLATKETSLLNKIVDRMSTTKGFFYAGMTFFAAPELLAYGAGLSRLPYVKFILILWPISIAINAVLVFFGSMFDLSSSSLLISVILPLAGIVFMFFGGWLFARGLRKEGK